ncbi:MAG: hypothetical protein WBN95_05625 [Gammaproteobacteria bacterium]
MPVQAVIVFRLSKIFILLLLVSALSGCASVSFNEPKPYSETLTDTADTGLGKEVTRWVDEHGGLSGFYPLQLKTGSVFVDFDVLSDSPDKLINEISEERMRLATDLREVLLSADEEIIFISLCIQKHF